MARRGGWEQSASSSRSRSSALRVCGGMRGWVSMCGEQSVSVAASAHAAAAAKRQRSASSLLTVGERLLTALGAQNSPVGCRRLARASGSWGSRLVVPRRGRRRQLRALCVWVVVSEDLQGVAALGDDAASGRALDRWGSRRALGVTGPQRDGPTPSASPREPRQVLLASVCSRLDQLEQRVSDFRSGAYPVGSIRGVS